MELAIVITKVLGVYFVVSGLFLIFKRKTVTHMLKDFFDHPAMVYLTGIIMIFLSSAYLIQFSMWDGSWETVVTVFAWLVLLKGLAYIFIPESLNHMVVNKYKSLFFVYGAVAIAVGVTLLML
ncbi:MAG TPA: hypothetical protein VFQ59_00700 [Candidatus Paceibacterota bacterium]|nr:hypothetical protein [Candidatus Paceibacterota bacterium]